MSEKIRTVAIIEPSEFIETYDHVLSGKNVNLWILAN